MRLFQLVQRVRIIFADILDLRPHCEGTTERILTNASNYKLPDAVGSQSKVCSEVSYILCVLTGGS